MCDLKAILPPPQIKQQKLISIGGAKLGIFEIHAPDPVSLTLEMGHQMVTNKAPGSGDNYLLTI